MYVCACVFVEAKNGDGTGLLPDACEELETQSLVLLICHLIGLHQTRRHGSHAARMVAREPHAKYIPPSPPHLSLSLSLIPSLSLALPPLHYI